METPAVQKMAVLTLIDPRTNEVESRTITSEPPTVGGLASARESYQPYFWIAPHLLDFCARHCVAPSDVQVSLSTIH